MPGGEPDCLYLVKLNLQHKLRLFPAHWSDIPLGPDSCSPFPVTQITQQQRLVVFPADGGSIWQWILKSTVENNPLKLFSWKACQIQPRQDLRGKLSLICIKMSWLRQFEHPFLSISSEVCGTCSFKKKLQSRTERWKTDISQLSHRNIRVNCSNVIVLKCKNYIINCEIQFKMKYMICKINDMFLGN